ncbi:TIP41-like family-domain-containing protein [Crepidotus variabilis]|uniref:TIP41-like family-domain-containing protein n=1 Tax=Crepidotus variabilis TaxID=179855 RepID=A0A9P6ERM0_9AGAR|nr:TIP41-like family-domain-containing protein [Crepidotus variabilis]
MSPPQIPKHTLQESPTTRSITVSNWTITSSTHPISNAPQCDALHASLGGNLPLPEMTFGQNYLSLLHRPTGKAWAFTTDEALRCVKTGELSEGDGPVKVGYADKWLQSRTGEGSMMPMPEVVATKPYDWTYTTTYTGHETQLEADTDISSIVEPRPINEAQRKFKWVDADPEERSQSIPLAELSRPDPILFYAEIPLFEDELHDNGSSSLLVRIRVMPTCFFLLSRFTLRVDNVLFRTFDTRIYHSFSFESPPILVRELGGWEAPYDHVQRHLPKRDDLTPLTDPTFIAKVLTEMSKRISQREGAKTGWRGLGSRAQVAAL